MSIKYYEEFESMDDFINHIKDQEDFKKFIEYHDNDKSTVDSLIWNLEEYLYDYDLDYDTKNRILLVLFLETIGTIKAIKEENKSIRKEMRENLSANTVEETINLENQIYFYRTTQELLELAEDLDMQKIEEEKNEWTL